MTRCHHCGGPIPSGKRRDAKWCSSACGNNYRGRANYDPEKERDRRRLLKETSYRRKMLYNARSRAASRGIEFSITEEDIIIPAVCPVLGIPIEPQTGHRGYHDNSPSLDRRDNGRGYVPGNVCVISSKANTIKRGYSAAELRAVADYIDRSGNHYG